MYVQKKPKVSGRAAVAIPKVKNESEGDYFSGNRGEAIVPRTLQNISAASHQVFQLCKKSISINDLNKSVAAYKNKEVETGKAGLAYKNAQSRHDKAVAKRHKAGNPMTSEEQKAGMATIADLGKKARQLKSDAASARRRSDKMHNTYRAQSNQARFTQRFGGAQSLTHQGKGSSAYKYK